MRSFILLRFRMIEYFYHLRFLLPFFGPAFNWAFINATFPFQPGDTRTLATSFLAHHANKKNQVSSIFAKSSWLPVVLFIFVSFFFSTLRTAAPMLSASPMARSGMEKPCLVWDLARRRPESCLAQVKLVMDHEFHREFHPFPFCF